MYVVRFVSCLGYFVDMYLPVIHPNPAYMITRYSSILHCRIVCETSQAKPSQVPPAARHPSRRARNETVEPNKT